MSETPDPLTAERVVAALRERLTRQAVSHGRYGSCWNARDAKLALDILEADLAVQRSVAPRPSPAEPDLCGAILNCALPTNHDGLHERADGIRWSWHENIDHLPRRPSPAEPRLTHGRHCPCSACAREDWTNPDLAPCGMHGASCPAVYDPSASDRWTAAKHREDAKLVQSAMQTLAERRLTGRGRPFVPIEDASDLLMAMHRDGIYRPAEPPAGDLRDDELDDLREHFVNGSGAFTDSALVARLVNEIDRLRAALRDPAPRAAEDGEPLPVGAYVASALADANISCDSGEDVDRFLEQLAWRGYEVALKAETPEPTTLDVDVLAEALHETAVKKHNLGEGPLRAICDEPQSHIGRATRIAAAYSATVRSTTPPEPEDGGT